MTEVQIVEHVELIEDKILTEIKEVVEMESEENNEEYIFFEIDTKESDVDDEHISDGKKLSIEEIDDDPGLGFEISEIENEIYENIVMDQLMVIPGIEEDRILFEEEDGEHVTATNIEMNKGSQSYKCEVSDCNEVYPQDIVDLEEELEPVSDGNKRELETENLNVTGTRTEEQKVELLKMLNNNQIDDLKVEPEEDAEYKNEDDNSSQIQIKTEVSDDQDNIEDHTDMFVKTEESNNCDQCGKYFSQKGHLKLHKRFKHNECDQCGFRLDSKEDLAKHNQITHDCDWFPCKHCEQKFSLTKDLVQHIQATHNQALCQIEECGDINVRTVTQEVGVRKVRYQEE